MLLKQVLCEHFTRVASFIMCRNPMRSLFLDSFCRFKYCGSERLINSSKVTQLASGGAGF